MKRQTVRGVLAMAPEGYARPQKAAGQRARTELPWWASGAVVLGLTMGLAMLDAVVLYPVLNAALTQSSWMGKVTCVGIAAVLNILPLVMAHYCHLQIYRLDPGAWRLVLAALLAFLLLFAGTVVLRVAYADLYGQAQDGTLVNVMEETEGDGLADDGKADATVFLLCCEPLATSILAFCLAYILDDPVKRRCNWLRVRRVQLREARADLLACRQELQKDISDHELFTLDDQLYAAKRKEVQGRLDQLMARSRYLLARHLHDPAAISVVTRDAEAAGLSPM